MAVDGAERGRVVDVTPADGAVPGILGFGHDAAGELYAAVQDGRVLRLVPGG